MEANFVRHYRELQVYQLAFENAKAIYQLSCQLPRTEQALQRRLVESSRSVCAYIAEAWERQGWCLAKLIEAKRCTQEVQTWLAFAMDCGVTNVPERKELEANYQVIIEIIDGLVEIFSIY